MKKLLILSLIIVLACCTASFAAPKGNAALDAHLSRVNNDALSDMDTFMIRMFQVYGVSRAVIETMMHSHHLSPGEVYATYWLAQLSKRSPLFVADTYKANRGKGWGVIAKQLGIKPGSPEFHELKSGNGPFNIFISSGHGKGKEKKKKKWED